MRKKSILIAILIVISLAVAALSGGMGKKAPAKSGILSVSDIKADPAAYTGTVTVNGVVSGFARQDPKLFALVDTAEVKLCRTLTCGRFYLPVKYEGKSPKQGDEVNVTGTLDAGAPLFRATRVEVLHNLSFQGP